MSARTGTVSTPETREQRIEALMKELRPKIEETVRQLVERAVDVPQAEEFGAIDCEFRDAGLKLTNEVRQAAAVRRKKRVRRLQRDLRPVPARGQVSFVPGAAGADGARGGPRAARL